MYQKRWHINDDWIHRDGFTVWNVIDQDGRRSVVRFDSLVVEPIEEGSYVSSDKGLHLSHDEAQQLMNELWRVGLRPRDGAGSLAHVEAQKAHLDDMRKLVFKGPGSSEHQT